MTTSRDYLTCYALIKMFFVGFISAQDDCPIVRDTYTPYPWLVNIFFQKVRGHGALITPDRVISAYNDFEGIIDLPDERRRYDMIITRFGADGTVICRQAKKAETVTRSTSSKSFLYWQTHSKFIVDVASSYPFLFAKIEYINEDKMKRALSAALYDERCTMPLLEHFSKRDITDILRETVKFKGSETCKQEFPALNYHHNWQSCDFCSEFDDPAKAVNADWKRGAVMLCRGVPLGILTQILEPKNSTGRKGLLFESLVTVAGELKQFADNEWPEKTTTTTTTTTTRTTTKRTMPTTSMSTTTTATQTKTAPTNRTVVTTTTTIRTINKTTATLTTFIRTHPSRVRPLPPEHSNPGRAPRLAITVGTTIGLMLFQYTFHSWMEFHSFNACSFTLNELTL